ncbi:predicted protein [Uncinocarpus reesii 1704]|uniref:Uncharacterized protein n=1 Tax=Uncinocarpus reesii (strain UAMH 1704) TaxID=336963 RepID=C4K0B0_UNCRE|nr:uncharacterized protein UREG_07924 [Uncinocarpus reesii 1704]EEP83059.1 predicted protein [Uncinocarpus reesii 1704]
MAPMLESPDQLYEQDAVEHCALGHPQWNLLSSLEFIARKTAISFLKKTWANLEAHNEDNLVPLMIDSLCRLAENILDCGDGTQDFGNIFVMTVYRMVLAGAVDIRPMQDLAVAAFEGLTTAMEYDVRTLSWLRLGRANLASGERVQSLWSCRPTRYFHQDRLNRMGGSNKVKSGGLTPAVVPPFSWVRMYYITTATVGVVAIPSFLGNTTLSLTRTGAPPLCPEGICHPQPTIASGLSFPHRIRAEFVGSSQGNLREWLTGHSHWSRECSCQGSFEQPRKEPQSLVKPYG